MNSLYIQKRFCGKIKLDHEPPAAGPALDRCRRVYEEGASQPAAKSSGSSGEGLLKPLAAASPAPVPAQAGMVNPPRKLGSSLTTVPYLADTHCVVP